MNISLVTNFINKRYHIEKYDRENIKEFAIEKIQLKNKFLSEKEIALKSLIYGCAKVKGRIEEFDFKELKLENIKIHFIEIAKKLAEKLQIKNYNRFTVDEITNIICLKQKISKIC